MAYEIKGRATGVKFKNATMLQYKAKGKKIRIYSIDDNNKFLIQILRLKKDIGGEFAKSINERGLISGSLSLTKETFYELAYAIGKILEEIEE